MHDVDFIEHDGRRFALVPEGTWEDIQGYVKRQLDEESKVPGHAASFSPPLLVQASISAGSSELRAWRRFRGVSIRQLAMRIGVTRAYISMIETGRRRPAPDLLRRLAKELDIPLRALMTNHGSN